MRRDALEPRPESAPLAGAVVEALPSALYRVRLEDGPLVVAHATDQVNRNFVRLLVGDRVRVELSSANPGRGRIVEKLRGN